MDLETEKIIKTQMEKLPEEIRKIFTDPELGNKILNIGKKNGLNIEQLGILETETNLVMLGLVHPDDYGSELENHLHIDDVKANTIVKDVNKEILSGILDELKEIYERDENEEDPDKDGLSLVSESDSAKPSTQNIYTDTLPKKYISPQKTPEVKKAAVETNQVLSTHGIEIHPVRDREGSQRPSVSNGIHPPDLTLPELNAGEKTSSILEQKLSGSFKAPTIKTAHTLDNITKAAPPISAVDVKIKTQKSDPYREVPE